MVKLTEGSGLYCSLKAVYNAGSPFTGFIKVE